MAEKTDKLPTISIKGKEYVLVKDRILAFHEMYPNGSIRTSLVTPPESQLVIIKAEVLPDVNMPTRSFTGYSQAQIGGTGVNMNAALENAETSAVGRALAMLGIGVLESIASADELTKARGSHPYVSAESQSNSTSEESPACPRCGGPMWDNRATKTNPTQPDYRCKAYKEGCRGAIWLSDDMQKLPFEEVKHS